MATTTTTTKIDGTRHSHNDNSTSTDSITDSNRSRNSSSSSSSGTQTSLQSSPTSVAILPSHHHHHHTTTDSTACKKASSFSLVSFVRSKLGRPPLQAAKSSLSQKLLYHNNGNTNDSSLHSNQHCYKVPHVNFCISGMAQVSAKACTSIALSYGLSYPIATLTKSGKMAPVMIGSIYYGNATYTVRDYIQVALIIFGTAMVSFGSSSSTSHHGGSISSGQKRDSMLGVLYILMSLLFDGVTAGYQKRFQHDMSMMNVQPKSYDYMYYTNIYMFGTALTIALLCNEIPTGMTFLFNNPVLFYQIIQFTICSAIGQSFIFYTLANFDPLVLSTVTTTRKIFSVLLSIFLKGHSLSYMGWTGISIACSGILSEMHHKIGKKKHTS